MTKEASNYWNSAYRHSHRFHSHFRSQFFQHDVIQYIFKADFVVNQKDALFLHC